MASTQPVCVCVYYIFHTGQWKWSLAFPFQQQSFVVKGFVNIYPGPETEKPVSLSMANDQFIIWIDGIMNDDGWSVWWFNPFFSL